MPILYRASFGYLRRHPWQLFLALVGICIGVAVMVAIDLASESSRKAFFMSMDSINGEATHQIVGGPGGIDEELYRQLRVENGIRSVAPVVSGYLQIDGASFQLLGVDVFAEREFRAYASTGSMTENLVGTDASDRSNANGAMSAIRRLLTNSGVLLLTSRTAATLGLAVNDQFPITVDGHEYMATLGGTLDADNGIGLDNVVIGDIGFVQGWLGMQAKLSRIDVRMSDEAVLTRISELLPPGVSLLSAEGRTQSTAAMSEAFTTNLFAMSLLALLVGVFLIYNSVSFAVLQRRELIGVFRALGVSRGQIFRLVMAEAFILGLVGAVLGLWVGVLLGEQLVVLVSRTINDHYFASNVVDVSLPASTLTKGLLAGVCATLLAASIPAIEASAVRPRLALMRSVIEMRAQSSLPILAIAGAALIVISLLLLVTSGEDLAIGLIAVFAIILGYAFCIPLAVAWCSKLLVGIANRYAGTTARMTAGNLGASLSRTGVAIVSLAIAVSATIGVGVMVNSFRISVGDWLESTLQSDIYVGVPRGNLDPALIPDLISVAGVREFSTARRNWLESEGGRIGIFAVKPAPDSSPGLSIRSDDPTAVWQQLEGDKTVLVSDPYAINRRLLSAMKSLCRQSRAHKYFVLLASTKATIRMLAW